MSERRIRIAYLITDLDVGGAENNLVALALGLDRSRYEVHVATLKPAGTLAERLRAAGIPVFDLRMRGKASVLAFVRLVRWLREVKPDILHTWLFHANFLGRLATLFARVPAVVSSIRVAEPRRSHLFLDRITQRRADVMLVNSQSLRDYEVAHGIEPERLHVIPNAVDVERFRIAHRAKLDTRVLIVLFIGRLDRQKGVGVLLEAAAELSKRRRDFRFVIAGDGPERAPLMMEAARLQLANVEFLGFRTDVPELLADADVFVLPSRWEGMPNVVLEAMAAGCPVVATRVTGTVDLVADGVNGLLVPPDDAPRLAGGIERLADDGTLREQLISNGRRTAADYSITALTSAHNNLYIDLCRRISGP
jgi:glycosyltransferase involved in cell wall biosynthesis